MNWLGGNGFGATMTHRRDRLPGDIKVSTSKKTESSEKKNVARLFYPIVYTNNTEKEVEKITSGDGEEIEHITRKAFKRVHMSFHSTESCNISTINALNYFKTSAMIRERR